MPRYTLNELIEMMEPQAQRDKALINQCIGGLGLYAAQCAQTGANESKVEEMRKLVENLVGYWGLDAVEYAPSLEGYLEAFDEQIHSAKSGAEITGDTYRRHADTIYGLHRYGEELIVCQGDSVMSEILDISDLINNIAGHWDFEPSSIVSDLAEKLRAEVRTMLDAIPLLGQPVNEVNAGYTLRQAILFDNDRGFAMAYNPKAPAPYVTWQFTNEDGKRNHYWGNYMATDERARIDYISRVSNYKESYKVTEKPIPTAAAEMITEQNLNMIDGVRNNEAPAVGIVTASASYPAETADIFDPTVTMTDMYAYGYVSEGVIPLGKECALELFDKGLEIYLIYEDNTEGLADSREDIENFDGLYIVDDPSWKEKTWDNPIDVFIVNWERYDKDGTPGEWLALPANADTLLDVFKRIGVGNPSEYTVVAVRTQYECLDGYVSKYDGLDELNMLASYMSNTEDYNLDKLQAILTSDIMNIGEGIAALINVLDDDNLDAFGVIDVKDAEGLGRYYEEGKPYGISFEEYGRQIARDEKGSFTDWGYIYCRYKELLPAYVGAVPNEYRIVSQAVSGLKSNSQEHNGPNDKPSVLDKIRTSRTAPNAPKDKAAQRKSKGGPEL